MTLLVQHFGKYAKFLSFRELDDLIHAVVMFVQSWNQKTVSLASLKTAHGGNC